MKGTTMHLSHRAARSAAGALLLTLALAACGDDDGGDQAAASETTTTTAPASDDDHDAGDDHSHGDDGEGESEDESEAEAMAIEVTAVDFAFEDLPDSVPAGTRLTLVNDAPRELHELVAFRLPDSEERSVEELVALPPDELLPTLGAPATVLVAPPGGEQITAVGDGTLTEPGRYAILCVIPSGVDADEYLAAAAESGDGPPDVGGGPPHIAHGMYAELVVEG